MYLRNYYKHDEFSVFNEGCNSLRSAAVTANDQITGVYAKLCDGTYLVCFRNDRGILMLQYKGVQFSIEQVVDLEKKGNDFFLICNGVSNVEVIKDTIMSTEMSDCYLTMEEDDDFNFLLYIYRLSQDKDRQLRVFNNV